jgi:cation diffusion facilitator family transporter
VPGHHPHDHTHPASLSSELGTTERLRAAQRATWVSAAANLLLTIAQLVVGWVAHSQSLIAHGLHSFSDLLSDFLVLWANHQGAHPADAAHPYGHARIETAATLVLGISLAIVGGGILLTAGQQLQSIDALPAVEILALWVALATLAVKEGLFHYLKAAARRLRSSVMMANAWHTRADAASALVVAIGIGGSLMGWRFLDLLAAVLVGFMILRMGLQFAWEALRELVDTGLPEEEVEAIRTTLGETGGVVDLHELRTRRMAHQALVDAHIRVDPRISVSEGHRIAESARRRVLEAHPAVLDVLVHVDAEDDSMKEPQTALPGRKLLEKHLSTLLGPDAPAFERVLFHYLGRQVEAEVHFAEAIDPDRLATIEQRLSERLEGDPWIRTLSLHARIGGAHHNGAIDRRYAP